MLERWILDYDKVLNKFTEEIQKDGKSTKQNALWLLLSFLEKNIVTETAVASRATDLLPCDSAGNAQ